MHFVSKIDQTYPKSNQFPWVIFQSDPTCSSPPKTTATSIDDVDRPRSQGCCAFRGSLQGFDEAAGTSGVFEGADQLEGT